MSLELRSDVFLSDRGGVTVDILGTILDEQGAVGRAELGTAVTLIPRVSK
jgi:hypothetical protein